MKLSIKVEKVGKNYLVTVEPDYILGKTVESLPDAAMIIKQAVYQGLLENFTNYPDSKKGKEIFPK